MPGLLLVPSSSLILFYVGQRDKTRKMKKQTERLCAVPFRLHVVPPAVRLVAERLVQAPRAVAGGVGL